MGDPPVLIALVWLATQVAPVPQSRFVANQRAACLSNCARQALEAPFCEAFCGCLIDRLDAGGRLRQSFPASDAERATLEQTRAVCYDEASAVPSAGGAMP